MLFSIITIGIPKSSLDSFGNTALFTFHDPAGEFMDKVIIVGGHDHRFPAIANG